MTDDVRGLAQSWLWEWMPGEDGGRLALGLPEWDERLGLWRVALVSESTPSQPVGEIQVDANGEIYRAPAPTMVAERLRQQRHEHRPQRDGRKSRIAFPPIPNKAVLGDCRPALAEFPPDSAQLVFTSPPYFNAKIECAEYVDYPSYLAFLGEVFAACHDVLAEGRFLVVNVSPVLVRRTSRSTASRRLPIPFDLHPILNEIGFEFIDDIIWRKPEGAGWHLGRGRRFAADRQPLQYKPVTVTEYVLVYRKKTDRLIDWNLRNHPDPEAVENSLILGDYDKTNVWDITPSSHKAHPAVFPDELVSRVIRYYSFEGDCVLDPFAGTGTVGRVAATMGRRFVVVEKRADYFETMRRELGQFGFNAAVDFDDLQYYWSAERDAEPV
ncbi:MAG: site-specific DNA-methyltransferase [Chloroflexota bacterium]|nr:site-specific DNA-methyltransferase [Chloroflexota bacterium]MDE2685672.1 site-specific DNA-methyltransferase [Chloroflexota bacterium]